MRKKKHFYTVVSLIVGVIILTTAAAANFENANGYTAYKNALKKMLYADNFTASLDMELIYNDTTQYRSRVDYKLDKDGEVAEYTAAKELEGAASYENETWVVKRNSEAKDGTNYIRISRSGSEWHINRSYDFGITPSFGDDEVTRKTIRFVELLADTFVGDLKNNFVLTSNENGVKSYQIILSGNQLPEYVTAGISVLYSAAKQGASSFVVYDEKLDTSAEDFDRISSAAWRMLSEKGHKGVVYVKEDGSLVYFATSDLYYQSEYYKPDMTKLDDVFRTLKTEPVVETAKCFITVDSEGRFVSNTLEGTLSAFDMEGNKHSITLRISVNISDHGTTVIDMPVIPEEDTVYDYSEYGLNENYSYRLTTGGVTKTVIITEDKEKALDALQSEAVEELPEENEISEG